MTLSSLFARKDLVLKRCLLVALAVVGLALTGCPTEDPPFEYVLEDQDSGFLSVHGTSDHDVWVAGGADSNGTGLPTVLHYDGAGWTRQDLSGLDVEGTDLWWIHAFTESDVMVAGENGTILRYDGTGFTRMTTPGTRVIFGLWGQSASDVWAVGGQNGGASGFVWHFDGSAWTEMTLPSDHPGAAVFKVWGLSASDVWFCGLMGTLMHWDGSALSMVASPTGRSLFTLHAIAGEVAVVGGEGTATVLRGADGVFTDVTPRADDGTMPVRMNGVWLTAPGEGYAVGVYGDILRQRGGVWAPEAALFDHLHAVWVDPSGGVWAVGGEILSEPLSNGVVVHRGSTIESTVTEE
jgi:hypothetical protein